MDEEIKVAPKPDKYEVPLWHKSNLTIDEAVAYSGIG